MPSPFPGMNPYLERAGDWEDFHGGFLHRLRAQLAAKVRPRYHVRVDKQVYLRELPDLSWQLVGKPDPAVTGSRGPAVELAAIVSSPVRVRLATPAVEEVGVTWLEVVHNDSEAVVTVLELLSPANKYAGANRAQYLSKRQRLIDAGVGYVELDLLRGGPRTTPDLPACDYCAIVVRAADRPEAAVWPWRLVDPFPNVPVPLRPGEPEPMLDLKGALDEIYDEAMYADFIYRGEPEPRLSAADAEWAKALVAAAG